MRGHLPMAVGDGGTGGPTRSPAPPRGMALARALAALAAVAAVAPVERKSLVRVKMTGKSLYFCRLAFFFLLPFFLSSPGGASPLTCGEMSVRLMIVST